MWEPSRNTKESIWERGGGEGGLDAAFLFVCSFFFLFFFFLRKRNGFMTDGGPADASAVQRKKK